MPKIRSKRNRSSSKPYSRPKRPEAGRSHQQPAEPRSSCSRYVPPSQNYPDPPEPRSDTSTDSFVDNALLNSREYWSNMQRMHGMKTSLLESFTVEEEFVCESTAEPVPAPNPLPSSTVSVYSQDNSESYSPFGRSTGGKMKRKKSYKFRGSAVRGDDDDNDNDEEHPEAGPSHHQPAEPRPSCSGYVTPNQNYPDPPEPRSDTSTDSSEDNALLKSPEYWSNMQRMHGMKTSLLGSFMVEEEFVCESTAEPVPAPNPLPSSTVSVYSQDNSESYSPFKRSTGGKMKRKKSYNFRGSATRGDDNDNDNDREDEPVQLKTSFVLPIRDMDNSPFGNIFRTSMPSSDPPLPATSLPCLTGEGSPAGQVSVCESTAKPVRAPNPFPSSTVAIPSQDNSESFSPFGHSTGGKMKRKKSYNFRGSAARGDDNEAKKRVQFETNTIPKFIFSPPISLTHKPSSTPSTSQYIFISSPPSYSSTIASPSSTDPMQCSETRRPLKSILKSTKKTFQSPTSATPTPPGLFQFSQSTDTPSAISESPTCGSKKRVQFETNTMLRFIFSPALSLPYKPSSTPSRSEYMFSFAPPIRIKAPQIPSYSSTIASPSSTAPMQFLETRRPLKSILKSTKKTFESPTSATPTPPGLFQFSQSTNTHPAISQSPTSGSPFRSIFPAEGTYSPGIPQQTSPSLSATQFPTPQCSSLQTETLMDRSEMASPTTWLTSPPIFSSSTTHTVLPFAAPTPPDLFPFGQSTNTPPGLSQSQHSSSTFQPSFFPMATTSTAPMEWPEESQPAKSWTRPFLKSKKKNF